MAMITFTSGWTFSSVCVSSNARLRSSSLGPDVHELSDPVLRGELSRMFLIHSFWSWRR